MYCVAAWMQAKYKDYVLFMLFIKYVSDKYANFDGFDPPIVIP
jgi:type I restriction enzyme M protein